MDRDWVADLLEFEGVVEHTRDAMWGPDLAVEPMTLAVTVMTTIDRLAEDLQVFATEEFGFVELDDAHSRTSVIMPQKKNPYALAALRGEACRVLGTWAEVAASGLTPSGQPDNPDRRLLGGTSDAGGDPGRDRPGGRCSAACILGHRPDGGGRRRRVHRRHRHLRPLGPHHRDRQPDRPPGGGQGGPPRPRRRGAPLDATRIRSAAEALGVPLEVWTTPPWSATSRRATPWPLGLAGELPARSRWLPCWTIWMAASPRRGPSGKATGCVASTTGSSPGFG